MHSIPDENAASYIEEECCFEFDRLFPDGFGGLDVIEEIAPDGWPNSPLLCVFHPTAKQIHEETVRMHRNLKALARPDRPQPAPPEPTLAEIESAFRDTPPQPETEVRNLVGQCLWDIFSDNHEVVGPDGRVLDLGSFRASGGFLADYLNRRIDGACYDYIDFYLGTIWVAGRADLAPVYEMIFRRLKQRNLDWVYHFPELHAIDFRPLRDALQETKEPEWTNYSPEKAFAKEQEESQRDKELADLREQLSEGNREAREAALKNPPPITVLAYQNVYGTCPKGWPPGP